MTGKHASNTPPPDDGPAGDFPDISEQRAEIAETVAALADKADVPARVRNEATFQVDKAKSLTEDNPTIVAATAIGALAALVGLVLWRRRRNKQRILKQLTSTRGTLR